MKRPAISAGVLILASLATLACRVDAPAAQGEPAPPFELSRLDGSPVTLASLAGKLVLVDFWATWCPPCILEIPELNSFYQAHREAGVEILAISVDDETPEWLKEWATKEGIEYPVAIGDMDVARAYGAEQFPFHVLIGREGQILARLTPGYHDREELDELIAPHLN